MNRLLACLLTAAGTALVTTQFAGSTQQLTGPGIIRITAREKSFLKIDDGQPGVTPGDMEISRAALFNTRIRKKPLGHAQLVCVLTGDGFRNCTGTFILPAGKIAVSGALIYRDLYDLAVVGGTGKYNNVSGTLTVTRINRKHVADLLVFRLLI